MNMREKHYTLSRAIEPEILMGVELFGLAFP